LPSPALRGRRSTPCDPHTIPHLPEDVDPGVAPTQQPHSLVCQLAMAVNKYFRLIQIIQNPLIIEQPYKRKQVSRRALYHDVTNFRAIFSVLLRQNSLSLFQQQMFCQNLEGEVQLPELIGDVVQLQRETAVRQAASKRPFLHTRQSSSFSILAHACEPDSRQCLCKGSFCLVLIFVKH